MGKSFKSKVVKQLLNDDITKDDKDNEYAQKKYYNKLKEIGIDNNKIKEDKEQKTLRKGVKVLK